MKHDTATGPELLRQSIESAVMGALLPATVSVKKEGESVSSTFYARELAVSAMTDLIERYFNKLTEEK